jgi:hypothetical protein
MLTSTGSCLVPMLAGCDMGGNAVVQGCPGIPALDLGDCLGSRHSACTVLKEKAVRFHEGKRRRTECGIEIKYCFSSYR